MLVFFIHNRTSMSELTIGWKNYVSPCMKRLNDTARDEETYKYYLKIVFVFLSNFQFHPM